MIDRAVGEDGLEIAAKLFFGRKTGGGRRSSYWLRRLWRATGKKSSERDVRDYYERSRSMTHFFASCFGAGVGSFGVTAMSNACIAARIEFSSIFAMPASPSRRP